MKKYTGPGGDVTIPEGITVIGDSSFRDCKNLTSVTIPESVTEIGKYAFTNCTDLNSVTIPESVTLIAELAFQGCKSLTSVNIPNGVTEIGEWAFSGCTGLTEILVDTNNSVYHSVDGMLLDKKRLLICPVRKTGNVAIPEGVTEIRNGAFSGCTDLTSVVIPKSVTEIGKWAFNGCRPVLIAPHIPIADFDKEDKPGACAGFAKLYLEKAELDKESKASYLKYIKGQKKKLYPVAIKHEELLRLMFAEKMLVRKDIDLLLEECDKQNNVAAKAAVLDYAGRNIEPVDPMKEMDREFAAMERSAKNQEEFQATGVMKVGEAKRIFRYKKLEKGGLIITGYKGTDTDVVIPKAIGKDPVTEIGKSAFKGCTGLTGVTIPEGVTEIGGYAFAGCTGLTGVTIPEGVTEIGGYAFAGCTGLTSVTIPEGVTKIGWGAFYNCKGLTSVTIPEGVTEIGDDFFSGCTGLTSVTIPESITKIGWGIFGYGAFEGCTCLTSVTIPAGVTEIGGVPSGIAQAFKV